MASLDYDREYNDHLLSKENKDLFYDFMEKVDEHIDSIVTDSDVYELKNLYSVESVNREGFWSWNDGGVAFDIDVSPSYSQSTGFDVSFCKTLQNWLEKQAYNTAYEGVDDPDSLNEDEQEEKQDIVDDYMYESTITLRIDLLFHSGSEEANYCPQNKFEGKDSIYLSLSLIDEYGKTIHKDLMPELANAVKWLPVKNGNFEHVLKLLFIFIKRVLV